MLRTLKILKLPNYFRYPQEAHCVVNFTQNPYFFFFLSGNYWWPMSLKALENLYQ